MRICVLLPYSNPHVTGWIDELAKVHSDVELAVGVVKTRDTFKRTYFAIEQERSNYYYFFKGKRHRDRFYVEVSKANVFISLGLFDIDFFKIAFLIPPLCSIFVLSEPFNPINSRRSRLIRNIYSLFLKAVLRGRRISFLAIGGQDVRRYYSTLGFKDSCFLNFGYFPKLANAILPMERRDVCIRFLFVGQLIHRKGIDVLVKLVRYIEGKHKDWRFCVIGDGPLKTTISSLSAAIPNLKYVGTVDDPLELQAHYGSADILFLPSYFDGWGAVVNEGLSQGCSLLLSKHVNASKCLLKDGENGFLFDPYDVASLFASVDRYFANPHILLEHRARSFLIYKEWNHLNAAKSFYANLLGRPNNANESLLKAV